MGAGACSRAESISALLKAFDAAFLVMWWFRLWKVLGFCQAYKDPIVGFRTRTKQKMHDNTLRNNKNENPVGVVRLLAQPMHERSQLSRHNFLTLLGTQSLRGTVSAVNAVVALRHIPMVAS